MKIALTMFCYTLVLCLFVRTLYYNSWRKPNYVFVIPWCYVYLINTERAGVQGLYKPEQDHQKDRVARLGPVHETQPDQEGHGEDVPCKYHRNMDWMNAF